MSRTFWMVVGAVGGVAAYRKGTRTAARAKELGPMGSAQVAAQVTSRVAGRAAHGLGRLQEIRARREGRLLSGTAQEVTSAPSPAAGVAAQEAREPGLVVEDPVRPDAPLAGSNGNGAR